MWLITLKITFVLQTINMSKKFKIIWTILMVISLGMSNIGMYGEQIVHPQWMQTMAVCEGIWDVIVITFMVIILTDNK